MPPAMRGDVEIAYDGGWLTGGLEEAGTVYGRQRGTRHDVTIGAEFAPIAGISARVAIPVTAAWSLSWTEPSSMQYDPVTGSGTYVGGAVIDEPPSLSGGGVQGVWIGAAIAPFSESYALSQQVTWRVEAAFRTPSGNTMWSADGGRRGAAPGGSAWLLSAAFSTNRGVAQPYLVFQTLLEGAVTIDV